MTNETPIAENSEEKLPTSLGMRLKSAREALGLEYKDAAQQLRLSEKFIIMMEQESYPDDLPVTFIRGYIRSYAKLLKIPNEEIKQALEPIKHKHKALSHRVPLATFNTAAMTSGNYFMQFFTSIIILTIIGLMGMWWYTEATSSSTSGLKNPLSTVSQATTLSTAPLAESKGTQINHSLEKEKTKTTKALLAKSSNPHDADAKQAADEDTNTPSHNIYAD